MPATLEKTIANASNASTITKALNIISQKAVRMKLPGGLIWSVRIFFGLKTNTYKKSRIIRKYNNAFEHFIFKGYDQQSPGLFRPGSFRDLTKVCKN